MGAERIFSGGGAKEFFHGEPTVVKFHFANLARPSDAH